jgi:hypothetical protein
MLSRLRKGVVNFAHSLELIDRVMEKAAAGTRRGHLIERRRTSMASDARPRRGRRESITPAASATVDKKEAADEVSFFWARNGKQICRKSRVCLINFIQTAAGRIVMLPPSNCEVAK